ncbi:MAG: hypothetical protein OHK0039_29200 [Bacteroidia bacterium]
MKKLYSFGALALALLASSMVFGQRYVDIPASTDPTMPTDIYDPIIGDTTATGDRTDNNTIYRLENGKTYVFSRLLRNTSEWPLQIEAADLSNTDLKPALVALPNTSGVYPSFLTAEGDVTFRNLWIIVGENGPLNDHKFGSLRLAGPGTRMIVEDCILEKERGGFIQVRADSVKVYVDNCILRNGGNRRILQGNGRGIDFREFTIDTLIMTNTVVHNIVDRFVRSQGSVAPHNYIEIDHCTSFNHSGRHGFIQLGQVRTAVITNNLFINPIMAGTTPRYADEQNQPDGDAHKVITLDTLYSFTQLTISNNNIFWTQDVLDYWASNDSVSQPAVLSQLVKESLGADTSGAYFSEVIALESVPQSILPYVQDLYSNPAATDMFDIIVEDSLAAGGPTDSGNLFDFATFSVCYDENTQSATASTTGGPVGAVTGCQFSTSIADRYSLSLAVVPNPVGSEAGFTFELTQAGVVTLDIYDLSGRRCATVWSGVLPAGAQRLRWEVPAHLGSGLYLASLRAAGQVQTLKLIVD